MAFIQKVCLCIQLLGGEVDILSTVSSWRQTLPDDLVLHSLDLWLESKLFEMEETITEVHRLYKES